MCGQRGPREAMFGLTLFPALRTEAFQQWFVHPACAKAALDEGARDYVRDEIDEMWAG